MGLFDLFGRTDHAVTRSALDEANDPDGTDDAVTTLIKRLTAVGIDGVGPYSSAQDVARQALERENGDVAAAIRRVVRRAEFGGAAGGFVTSLGGFLTMIVAIPANVFEFYVQATRMTAAVAVLRGYDVSDERIRTAILLTLVGSNAADILTRAGVATGSSAALQVAARGGLPRPALMVVQKAVGFRILRSVGERVFTRLGKLVPLAGGVFGAIVDFAMMKRIGHQAVAEFPG
ncbi:EcsC family protein [Propioniciclava coleopterorum]|uniref:EcsC family protein n=1 Tax=Propioniciclava coleopterorum TaxID=2714937 RepID=A0A6G7Y432_9ACTN|nr:EcsC family protein [Propioniciclava coleopterorum]QIK71580.1 EcsC family protein [Propioniciclava coleopterorum]